MAIQFIIGRSGTGKSKYVMDDIRTRLQEDPSGPPIIMLVPEQATFQAEYELVQTPGIAGMIRAQALSFHRLAFRVMQEVGRSAILHIDDTGKKMILHKIIHKRQKELRLFSHASEQMGFIDRVNELYKEMKRYRISGKGLSAYVQETSTSLSTQPMLGDKLHDLLLIYNDFEAELAKHYVDSEDYLAILMELMSESSYVTESEIWIDGFHGFTPQEYAVIEQLIRYAREVKVTIGVDRPYGARQEPHELDLFHPPATTMVQFMQIAEESGVEVRPTIVMGDGETPARFRHRPMLAHLEENSDRRIAYKGPTPLQPEISLNGAVSRRAEVEGMAREMLRLARDQGLRWREMAVLIRNVTDYEALLTTTLTDHGIPFFLDQKRTVLHHPLVEFIRSALEVVTRYWPYDAVFRCVKTDLLLPLTAEAGAPYGISVEGERFTELNLSRRHMDELENYVLAYGLSGSRWTSDRPWTFQPQRSLEEAQAAPSAREAAYLERIHVSRQAVAEPLLAFERALKAASDARGMAAALYALLERVRAAERLEQWSAEATATGLPGKAREHRQLWGSVVDMLDQIVETMGDASLTVEGFTGVVETGLESIKLGLVPPALDHVLVGSMERTRSGQIRYAFLLGVSDGVIPSRMSEDGVITEAEREWLARSGLTLAPGSRRRLLDERYLIYNAMTAPSEHLWLSYPLADEEGKTLLPSEVIRQVKNLFPSIRERVLMGEPSGVQDEEMQLDYVAEPGKALSYLIVQLREWKKGTPIADFWWEVYNWLHGHPDWEMPLRMLLKSLFFSNQEQQLSSSVSRQLYGDHLRASVSRMERFVACPFSHFASHGLRLQERRNYRLEAPDIGQLFHAALSLIGQKLISSGTSWGALTPDQCRKYAEEAVDELSPRLQSEILLSSKRFAYISRKLKDIVGRASMVLGEQTKRGSFQPLRLEMDFGPNKELPPLTFELSNGCTMEIIGRIDRVDSAETEQGLLLRVIDYKSSQTSLRLDEVYYGLALQLLTYLDVLVTNAESWLGRKAIPAGALYFHVHNPLLQVGGKVPQEVADDMVFKKFKMRGLVLADRDVVRMMDHTLDKGHSSMLPLAVKADGGFYSSASVMTEAQWKVLQSSVRGSIMRIGTEMTNGCVDIAPYRMGTKLPCTFCSYKPVCQFDTLVEGNDYHSLVKPDKDELWQLLSEKGANHNDDDLK